MVNTSRPLKILYFVSFFSAMQFALTAYINSTYVSLFIPPQFLGLLYSVASFFTVILLLEIPKFLSRKGNYRTFLWLSLGLALCLALLAVGFSGFIVVPALMIFLIFAGLIFASRDIFIQKYSEEKNIGRIRGGFLSVMNSSWVFAPLISGWIITNFGYEWVYLLAMAITVPVILFLRAGLKTFPDPEYRKIEIAETVKTIARDRDIRRIYLSNLLLQFFYAWMVIYTPIYLNQVQGLAWSQIGLIFTVMLIPFVILEWPLGKLSDRIGEKEMLIGGIVVMGGSTALLAFLNTQLVWPWMLVLFMTRVGAATVEVMTESYFFKKVHPEEADLISFFRNTPAVAYIIAPLLATFLFLFIPFKFLFLALAVLVFLGLRYGIQLHDTA
jgi:MFS family permease